MVPQVVVETGGNASTSQMCSNCVWKLHNDLVSNAKIVISKCKNETEEICSCCIVSAIAVVGQLTYSCLETKA